MKPRFLVFAGDRYYPAGGWKDFRGGFADYFDALYEATRTQTDWWHIVDLETGEVVDKGERE